MLVLLLLFAVPSLVSSECVVGHNGIEEIGCKSYSTCTNGVQTVTDCEVGKVYNHLTKSCDLERNVGPPCGLHKDCSSKHDGRYADTMLNCKSYYTCNGHTYFGHNFCTPGTVFSDQLQTCVWPDTVDPPCGTKGITTTTATIG